MALTDWEAIIAWDWAVTWRGTRLHHLAVVDDPALADADWNGTGRTSCGRRGVWRIPGLFTRMGAERCRACCRVTGYPQGTGSPKNDDACRPLVEAFLAEREAA